MQLLKRQNYQYSVAMVQPTGRFLETVKTSKYQQAYFTNAYISQFVQKFIKYGPPILPQKRSKTYHTKGRNLEPVKQSKYKWACVTYMHISQLCAKFLQNRSTHFPVKSEHNVHVNMHVHERYRRTYRSTEIEIRLIWASLVHKKLRYATISPLQTKI